MLYKYLFFLINLNSNSTLENSNLKNMKNYCYKHIYYMFSGGLLLVIGGFFLKSLNNNKIIKNKNLDNKIKIRYIKEDKDHIKVEFNRYLYNTYETSFTKCFKKFYKDKNLIKDLKERILTYVKENNVENSELLIKQDYDNNIYFVINSEVNDNKIFSNKNYSTDNDLYKIINNESPHKKYYENDSFMIIQNLHTNEASNLHLLLIPKKNYLNYVDFFMEAKEEEIVDLFKALYEIYNKYDFDNYLKKYKNIQDYSTLYINHNKGVFNKVRGGHGHQAIDHLHIHIYMPFIFKNKFIKPLTPINYV
jgi:histidine triad (HIT) family protein